MRTCFCGRAVCAWRWDNFNQIERKLNLGWSIIRTHRRSSSQIIKLVIRIRLDDLVVFAEWRLVANCQWRCRSLSPFRHFYFRELWSSGACENEKFFLALRGFADVYQSRKKLQEVFLEVGSWRSFKFSMSFSQVFSKFNQLSSQQFLFPSITSMCSLRPLRSDFIFHHFF